LFVELLAENLKADAWNLKKRPKAESYASLALSLSLSAFGFLLYY